MKGVEMTTYLKPPFSYFGSKARIAKQLVDNLPPHNCWIELFCGSAALTCAKTTIAPIEIINDLDSNIVNVFKQLRDNPDDLIRMVDATPYAREELELARIDTPEDSDLEKARKFFVASMFAINGAFGDQKGGFSCSHSYSRQGVEARVSRWNMLPDRLALLTNRLKQVRIEKMDGIQLLQHYMDRPATLVYIDPPYLGLRSQGYTHDLNDIAYHTELLETSNNAKCMIFISGYDHDLYRTLLSEERGWIMKQIVASTRGNNGVQKSRTELVWMNRHYHNAVTMQQLPVDLTTAEQTSKKVNPTR